MKQKFLRNLGALLMLLIATQTNAQISYVIDSVIPINPTDANLYLSYANHRGFTMLSPRYDTSMALTRNEAAQFLNSADTNGQKVFLLDSCVVGKLHYARVTFCGDSAGCSAFTVTNVVTFTMACPTPTVVSTLPTTLVAGQSVSGSATTSGGLSPYTYSWSGISGITLSTAGNFSGAPLSLGSKTYTVNSTDAVGCPASGVFTTTVSCASQTLTVTFPSTINVGQNVAGYSATVSGGIGQHTYSWFGNTVSGVSLSPTGAFTGTVTAAGTYTYTVQAVDSLGCPVSQTLTTVVTCPTPTFVSTLPTSLQVGASYTATVNASGQNSPYAYAWGSQPATLNLASNLITGTVTAQGTSVTTYTVTDTYGCQSVFTYTYTATCPAITIGPLPDDTVGTPIIYNLVISGGTAPYATSATGLPTGWSLATNQVTGTSSQIGFFYPNLTGTDFYGCPISKQDTVQIFCNTWTTTGVMNGIVGSPYSDTLQSTDTSVTYSLFAGSVPSGTILQTSGVLSGNPDSAGTYIYTVAELNQYSCIQYFTDTVVMTCPTLTVVSTLGNTLYPGQTPSAVVTTSGGTSPYTYNNWTGNPVTGLILSPSGAIGDTVSGAGTFIYTIPVVDANGCPGSLLDTTVVLCSYPVVTSPFVSPIGVGTVFTYTVSAIDSLSTAFTYTVTGNFIPGAVLASNGVVSDTANANGTYIFTLLATSNWGCTGSVVDTVVVTCPIISINPLSDNWIIGVAGKDTLQANNGNLPYTWTTTTLPPGLTRLDSIISGTPTNDGDYPVTVTVTDKYGCVATLVDTISIDSLLFIKVDSVGSITSTGASVYVSVKDNHDPNAFLYVGYGTSSITTFLPNQTLPLGDTNYVFTLSGLNPGTTYITGARALDTAGLIFSNTKTFTTLSAGPTILSTNVQNIMPESADILVNVSTGGAVTTVRIWCDNATLPTTLYTYTTSVSGWATIPVSNLNANATAYYYVMVLSAYGTDTTLVMSFVTPPYNVAATLLNYYCSGSKITAIANVYSNDPGAQVQLLYEQGWSLTLFASQTLPQTIGVMTGTVSVQSPTLVNNQVYTFAVKFRNSNGLEDTTTTGACTITSVSELEALNQVSVWAYGKTVSIWSPVEVGFTLYNCLGQKVSDVVVGADDEKSLRVAMPGVYLYQLRLGGNVVSGKLIAE